MNRILLDPSEVDDSGRALLCDNRAHHIREVLRTPKGGSVEVGLLDGPRGRGLVGTCHAHGVELTCEFEEVTPPRPPVDLLLALPRPKVMRRLWAPLASMGVGRIVLSNAARVERNYFDAAVLDPEGYRPLLIEGLQQARDTRMPAVHIRKQLKPFVEDELDEWFPGEQRIVADPLAAGRWRDLDLRPGHRVLLAIGPEGDWVDYERDLLRRHGFRAFTLGSRALRSDTACIAALALAHEALG